MSESPIARVAVPAPLFGLFDYTLPASMRSRSLVGCRVKVPFGRQAVVGVIMETADHSDIESGRLRAVRELLDTEPLLDPGLLRLLAWAADYYQHPIGEVVATALPALLRQGAAMETRGERRWQLTDAGRQATTDDLGRAPKQAALLQQLQQAAGALNSEQLNALMENWRPAMQGLHKKALAEPVERPCLEQHPGTPVAAPELNHEQNMAVAAVTEQLGRYRAFLLQGITGSGKTEVYLALVERVIRDGGQALVLVPEISLTPQLMQRFEQRLDTPIAALHSGLNDRQRLCAWSMVASGRAQVVIGTRSALFTPMPGLALIIVDEEHDASLKQQEGFRYNARDLALVRARDSSVPILLGSATPSLESLHNARRDLYGYLHLTRRAARATPPRIHLLDVRRRPMEDGLSDILLQRIGEHLDQQGQVLLFLNRRGFAPLLLCHECGWTTDCPRCDAHMTLHRHNQRLLCHHCGHERPAPVQCPQCNCESLYIPGAGTERIEQALQAHFPDLHISRIDRDTTRRKGALDAKLADARSGQARILIGTQMLAKGHDFPNVSLVGILDTDQGLFSSDFRGTEHMAQLIVQVAGRAGRAERPGEVYIQTHHPDHPLLQTLLNEGYAGFAGAALDERQQARFPPYAHMALLRAEATRRENALEFLQHGRDLLDRLDPDPVERFGPLPAPMEKRAGRYRAQLILQCDQRKPLHRVLRRWIPQLTRLKSASRVRWSIDVDPQDMY